MCYIIINNAQNTDIISNKLLINLIFCNLELCNLVFFANRFIVMSTRSSTAKTSRTAARTESASSASQVTASVQSFIPQAAITSILHPFTYGKTLIQVCIT